MQAIAEKMKGISSTLTLTITRTGDLHVQVNYQYLTLGYKLVNRYQHQSPATSISALIDLCRLQLFCPTHAQAQHIACRFLLQAKQPLLDCYTVNVYDCCAIVFCVQNSQNSNPALMILLFTFVMITCTVKSAIAGHKPGCERFIRRNQIMVMQVSGSSVQLGAEVRGLPVAPLSQGSNATRLR
jgi:hypothetical protein